MRLVLEGDPSVFRYLWLRYVTGFRPWEHCARCLVSRRDPRVNQRMGNAPVELEPAGAPFLYLCGGTPQWSTNLHVAAVPDPRSRVIVRAYGGTVVQLRGARMVPIPDRPDGFAGRSVEFTTCRNWRFGVEYFGLTAGWHAIMDRAAKKSG